MKKIFISHASKDASIMQAFIDEILVGSLSVKISDIFCTTTDGTKITSGEDWRNSIKDALTSSKITFLMITPNYKESEVSLCEMGAAWVSSGVVIPLIVEPINYTTVGIIQQPKQVEKLLDEKSLDRIRDLVQEHLNIPPKEIRSDRWTLKKFEFVEKVNKIVAANPFLPPISREDFDKSTEAKNELQMALKALIEEKDQLEKMNERLIHAKDAAEVKEIKKDFSNQELFDEFKTISEKIENMLDKLPSIIIGIIFKTYTDKNVSIKWQSWEEQIDDAVARDYISEELYANWGSTRVMSEIYSALCELNVFIRKYSDDPAFIDSYEEKFEAPLSMSNLEFWEEAFNVKVIFS